MVAALVQNRNESSVSVKGSYRALGQVKMVTVVTSNLYELDR